MNDLILKEEEIVSADLAQTMFLNICLQCSRLGMGTLRHWLSYERDLMLFQSFLPPSQPSSFLIDDDYILHNIQISALS